MVLEYKSHHLPHKSPSYVGKYTIHGAFGIGSPMVTTGDPPFHEPPYWDNHPYAEGQLPILGLKLLQPGMAMGWNLSWN